MGYLDIENLYKNQTILLFKECYALEKIHGSSGHISFKVEGEGEEKETALGYFSGGATHEHFVKIFNEEDLLAKHKENGYDSLIIFGEAYGGKMQGMSATYGKELKFIAFDIKIGESWLNVESAERVCEKLGLEFVHYVRIPTTLEAIDAQRDAPSVQAERNDCGQDKMREGVVLRPLVEMRINNGERVIVKHKRDEFKETKTPREVDPEKLQVLTEANEIAEEWVTTTRLEHVIDHVAGEKNKSIEEVNMEDTGSIIKEMVEDVLREGQGEFEESKEVRKAIGHMTTKIFKQYVEMRLRKGM